MALRTYTALLRGVNVGGNRKLPMSELRAALEELGYEDVATYIQSGNVVLRSKSNAGRVAAELEALIAERFRLPVKVLLRTPAELEGIADANPFLANEPEASRLHVTFLDRQPAREAVATLDPRRSPGDEYSVSGREIYLHYPNGSGRSKLTLGYFERRLGVSGTTRNWNTLLKLIELTAERSGG